LEDEERGRCGDWKMRRAGKGRAEDGESGRAEDGESGRISLSPFFLLPSN
jgi:hypothetical protein